MSAAKPKIVVIGAGSLFFGRQAIWQTAQSPYLNKGTLALVDTDADKLAKLKKLAEMVVAETGVDLKIEASVDRRAVLKDADFVVLSFAEDTVRYRGLMSRFRPSMESACVLATRSDQAGFSVPCANFPKSSIAPATSSRSARTPG